MQIDYYYLKLRKNISLEGDLQLAQYEAECFFENVKKAEVEEVTRLTSLTQEQVTANAKSGFLGFLCSKPKVQLDIIIKQLSFVQEVWCNTFLHQRDWAYKSLNAFCLLPLLCAAELLTVDKGAFKKTSPVQELTQHLAIGNKGSLRDISTGSTSTPHAHGLHKYKAKFFPRMIRAFLSSSLSSLPKVDGQLKILDPFVGSGTALLESSLLGIGSIGIDVDKLSCLISEAKLSFFTIDQVSLALNIKKCIIAAKLQPTVQYNFPSSIKKKFVRWNNLSVMLDYEETISAWISAIQSIQDIKIRKLLEVCLSDALTRKFVIRMMGTGVNRFALEIAKSSIEKLILGNFSSLERSVAVAQSIVISYALKPAQATVIHGNATQLPFDDSSFSMIITSPPYLPASSGRENYLAGKAISCTALNLMTNRELEEAEQNSIGSMKTVPRHESCELPDDIYKLYDWLNSDDLRKIKAEPTLAYYIDLKVALHESLRVLAKGGLAIYVIGKESTFYTFKTREVLFKVECDTIFCKLANDVGFSIEKVIDVELDKRNRNARPRSLDSYSESVVFLRK